MLDLDGKDSYNKKEKNSNLEFIKKKKCFECENASEWASERAPVLEFERRTRGAQTLQKSSNKNFRINTEWVDPRIEGIQLGSFIWPPESEELE